MTDHGTPHFFVFPDRDDVAAVVRRVRAGNPELRVVDHPSGRPWIAGVWADEDLAVARHGRDAVTLIGTLPRLDGQLAAWAGRVNGDHRNLIGLSASLAGDFHVLASVDGTLFAQGSAHGSRRVHQTRVDGALVLSDRALCLADLAGAEIDMGALAWKLLLPPPGQLDGRTMWHDVGAIRPGCYLVDDPSDEPERHLRWHRPPEPHLSLADGALAVREALVSAVATRTRHGGLMSADLSGGLDSTSLSSIAATQLGEGEFIVCTNGGDESINQDGHWARVAASHWPHVEHYQLPPEEQPLFYEGALDEGFRSDWPHIVAASRTRSTILAARMAERGSRLHMGGQGGDHLFFSSGAQYHGLLTRHPVTALRRIRAYGILYGWRWRTVARQLLDRRSYATTLRNLDLEADSDLSFSSPGLAWLRQPLVPSWLTSDARALLTEELKKAAQDPEPRADDLGRHLELDNVLVTTREVAGMNDASRQVGVPLTTPFFDDAVVDAALSVRTVDRASPYAYKPLLMEAMRGILPDACRERTTKAEGSFDAVGGLYRHRQELIDLWRDSALGKAGLIDAEMLADLCSRPGTPHLKDGAINSTLSCEVWLRTV